MKNHLTNPFYTCNNDNILLRRLNILKEQFEELVFEVVEIDSTDVITNDSYTDPGEWG